MIESQSETANSRQGSASQLANFCIVGAAAAAVHFSVVSLLVPWGFAPLVANVIAFLCAFGLSFFGHSTFTFPGSPDSDRLRALHRFFRVALLGFVANETLFWALLRFSSLGYQLSLTIVLLVVAASTLVLSKYWAFADG